MEIEVENDLLQKCLSQIEEQLNWGSSETWTNQDFEMLSDKIQEDSGTLLSITTLKRIWGKVKYESSPTITTLNTLARFIHFENWRAFVKQQNSLKEKIIGYTRIESAGKKTNKRWTWPAATAAVIAGGIFIFYLFSSENRGETRNIPKTGTLDTSAFQFSSKKIVSIGVPNSVIFNYDASSAPSTDSIFIQQSWDKHLTQSVSKNNHEHTSIYYYPGYFLARLVVNNEIIKYHPLFIQTNGWLTLVEENPTPIYFNPDDAKQNGEMSISLEMLKKSNVAMEPQTPWVDYYNVRNFGDLQTDNFVFDAQVRNDYLGGSGACGNTVIKILSEGSAVVIPLSIKGCVSDSKLYLLDHEIDGKNEDLSAFGCDISQWVNVRVEAKSNHLIIYVNNSKAYETTLTAPPSKISGIVFRFQGTGSVKSVSLAKPDGETVYEDHF